MSGIIPDLSGIDLCVSGLFGAGFPEHNDVHERIYLHLRSLDRQEFNA